MFIRMRLKVTWLEKGGEGKIFGSAHMHTHEYKCSSQRIAYLRCSMVATSPMRLFASTTSAASKNTLKVTQTVRIRCQHDAGTERGEGKYL
jgi:hypothetical protein